MENEQARIEALEARVAELEAAVEALTSPARPVAAPRLETLTGPPAAQAPAPAAQPPPPTGLPFGATVPAPPPAPEAAATVDHAGPGLDAETALKWGGIGLVVLAVAFAVNTAIQRGWIGPELQLAGALGLAFGLIGAGVRLRPTRMPWTHALCSGGVAALFITFGSSLFTDLAGDETAFVLIVATLLGAIALARWVPSEWTALVAVAGSVTAWLVVAEFEGPFIEAGAAFVVGFVVVVAVAVERDWLGVRLLTTAVAMVLVIVFAGQAGTTAEDLATLVAGALVAIALFVVPSLGLSLGHELRGAELRLPTLLAPWAWLVVSILVIDENSANDERIAGSIALAVTAAVVAIALAARPKLDRGHLIALLVGASTTLTAGIGLVLQADVVWVLVAVQGVGLLVLARELAWDWLVTLNAAVLLAVVTAFAAVDGVVAWETDTDLSVDLVRLGVVVALGVAVWVVQILELRRVGALIVLGLVMIWLGSVFVHLPQGQAIVSLSWAVIGVAALVLGAFRKVPEFGQVGLAVLAVTVAKLLLVDMAEVDALWRAGLFLVVGLALMRLGFLLPSWTAAERDELA